MLFVYPEKFGGLITCYNNEFALEEIPNWQFLNCRPSIWKLLVFDSLQMSSIDAICIIEAVINNIFSGGCSWDTLKR